MLVYNLDEKRISDIAYECGIELEHPHPDGSGTRFRAKAVKGECPRRYSSSGRLTTSPAYWSMAVFIGRLLFEGARVTTAYGRWANLSDFEHDAHNSLYCVNIGSVWRPVYLGDCEVDDEQGEVEAQAAFHHLVNAPR